MVDANSESLPAKNGRGSLVTPKIRRIFYVGHLAHERYSEIIRERKDIVLERLENDTPLEVSSPVLASAHAYQVAATRDELALNFHVTADLLRQSPNLLLVSSNGAGYDPVDVEACTARGVLVLNQAGGNAQSVAEHVVGMLLCLSKRIIEADRALRRGALIDRRDFIGMEASGKTIGIIGFGATGGRVCDLCRSLLEMKVLAYDPYRPAAEIAARGAESMQLDELLACADYVSVHCPLTAETRGMIGAREFRLMQRHAYFITAARGHIHDEKALAEALSQKLIAGAGLDVWATEPPAADHPLLQFDTVIASPHTAGVTAEARHHMGTIAAQQLCDALDGKRPPRLVNPAAWPHYTERFRQIFGFEPLD
jgi:D-3-phosphoglycerate dehydrogenase